MKKVLLSAMIASLSLGNVLKEMIAAAEVPDSKLVGKKAKKLREPMVQQYSTQAWCLFENANDEWCFYTTPPILSVGWNNTQVFT